MSDSRFVPLPSWATKSKVLPVNKDEKLPADSPITAAMVEDAIVAWDSVSNDGFATESEYETAAVTAIYLAMNAARPPMKITPAAPVVFEDDTRTTPIADEGLKLVGNCLQCGKPLVDHYATCTALSPLSMDIPEEGVEALVADAIMAEIIKQDGFIADVSPLARAALKTLSLDEKGLVEKAAHAVSEAGGAVNWEHALEVSRAAIEAIRASSLPLRGEKK